MPPAFALSQDQTLRFISGNCPSHNEQYPNLNRSSARLSLGPLHTGVRSKTAPNVCVCVSEIHQQQNIHPKQSNRQINEQRTCPHTEIPSLKPLHLAIHASALAKTRINDQGRRQRIPSSPIHISKNIPDQPVSTPLTEGVHFPVQSSFQAKAEKPIQT
jgi:hypothetical protein